MGANANGNAVRALRLGAVVLLGFGVTACSEATPSNGAASTTPPPSAAPSTSTSVGPVVAPELIAENCAEPAAPPAEGKVFVESSSFTIDEKSKAMVPPENSWIQYALWNSSDLVAVDPVVNVRLSIDGKDVTNELHDHLDNTPTSQLFPILGPNRGIKAGYYGLPWAAPASWKDADVKLEVTVNVTAWCVVKPGAPVSPTASPNVAIAEGTGS